MYRAARPLARLARSPAQPSRLASPLSRTRRPPVTTTRYPPRQAVLHYGRSLKDELERQGLEKKPPEEVTADSTTVAAFSNTPQKQQPSSRAVTGGIKAELENVKDAFALSTIPREVNALGLAGTLPYLATSLSTVFLSWNVNQSWTADANLANALLVDHDTAQYYVDLLEPVQIGYGAVIVSFLGAVHWGMEWNEKTPDRSRARARYAIGLLAPAVAWPTIMMPAPAALTTQFLAFTALYFVDGRMVERGWAPAWYAPYRFVLTLVVGVSLFVSLVGRAKIGERKKGLAGPGLEERLTQKGIAAAGEGVDWARLEEEEKKKRREKEREEEERRKKEDEKKAKGAKKEKEETEEKKSKKGAEPKSKKDEAEKKESSSGDDGDEENTKDKGRDGEDPEENEAHETGEKDAKKRTKDTKQQDTKQQKEEPTDDDKDKAKDKGKGKDKQSSASKKQ